MTPRKSKQHSHSDIPLRVRANCRTRVRFPTQLFRDAHHFPCCVANQPRSESSKSGSAVLLRILSTSVQLRCVGGISWPANQDGVRAHRLVRTSEQLFQESLPQKILPNSELSCVRSGRTSRRSISRSASASASAALSISSTANASPMPGPSSSSTPRCSNDRSAA